MKRLPPKKKTKYEICFCLDGVPTSKAVSEDLSAFAEAIAFYGEYLKNRFSYTISQTTTA